MPTNEKIHCNLRGYSKALAGLKDNEDRRILAGVGESEIIFLLKPSTFTTHVKPTSWGEERSWDQVIDDMMACRFDYETVTLLQKARRESGFREPVVVIDGQVANGMHRSVACLIDNTSVPVRFSYPHDDPHCVDVEFLAKPYSGVETEDSYDDLVCALRSFPLDDDVWVETDCIGRTSGIWSGTWYCPASHQALLLTTIKAQAMKAGYALAVTKSRSGTMDELFPEEN